MNESPHERTNVRRALRRAVDLPCEILTLDADEPLIGRATNLSPLGVWVEVAQSFVEGEEVVLTFRPPQCADGTELTLYGEVARVQTLWPHWDSPATGLGIEFVGLSPAEFQKLERCLHGLPPPFPVLQTN
jgi:hypothetical protein